MADGASDPLLEDRVQAGANGQRQVIAEAKIGQHQADNRVDGPGVKAPVEEGGDHRLTGGGRRASAGLGGREEMHHRLADTKIHQADAHAGGKQHRQPGGKAELGASIIRTEADTAIGAEGKHQQQDQEQADNQHIKPAEVLGNPALAGAEETGCRIRCQRTGQQQQTDHNQAGHQNGQGEGTTGYRGWLLCCHFGLRLSGYASSIVTRMGKFVSRLTQLARKKETILIHFLRHVASDISKEPIGRPRECISESFFMVPFAPVRFLCLLWLYFI